MSSLLLVCLGGCSLALSGPDPQRAAGTVPRCDTGKGLVGLDGVIGGTLGVASLATFAGDETGVGIVLGLASVAFIAAAVRGNRNVDECRLAIASFERDADSPSLDDDAPPRVVRSAPPVTPPPPVTAAPATPRTRRETSAPSGPAPAMTMRPATPAPAAPAARPQPAAAEDEWAEFWSEVP